MIAERITQITGKNRFDLIFQIEAKDLKPLMMQAYKDKISVQDLISQCIEASLKDLVTFSKGA